MGRDSQVGNDKTPSMRLDPHLLSGMGVLAAVIEAGSFTQAGELLGLSASGVSRAIARLEERVGVRLLDRTTRSSRLTNEGAHLYEFALPHLAGLQEVANVASGSARAVKGSLRVSLNAIFSRHVLAPNLPRFTRRYPALELTILHLPDSGDLITVRCGCVHSFWSTTNFHHVVASASGNSCADRCCTILFEEERPTWDSRGPRKT